MSIQKGRYRHYKGNFYEVAGIARHSETLEEYVVYRPLYSSDVVTDYWIRPLKMFTENVMVDGKEMPRFEWVGEME